MSGVVWPVVTGLLAAGFGLFGWHEYKALASGRGEDTYSAWIKARLPLRILLPGVLLGLALWFAGHIWLEAW